MVGASAGICGLVAAFSSWRQTARIYVWFVLPIARDIFFHQFGLTLLFLVTTPPEDPTMESHVRKWPTRASRRDSGGIAYLKWLHGLNVPLFGWSRVRRPAPARVGHHSVCQALLLAKGSSKPVDDLPPAEFISREVDPILDKISAHGIQS